MEPQISVTRNMTYLNHAKICNTLAVCGKSVGSGLERFTVQDWWLVKLFLSINCEP